MSAPELLPCPFCGAEIDVPGSPITRDIKSAKHPTNDCILSGQSWWHVPRFVGPWNTRADLPPTDAQIMADPRVRALVGALDAIETATASYDDLASDDTISVHLIAYAALAAMPGVPE